MMGPATLGLAATQFNIVINSRFASEYDGVVSWLSYAFRLLYLPICVFGAAIATVSTTSLSESVAKNDERGVRKALRDALSLLAFLTVPSSVGLWVLSEPIIALIYQRARCGREHRGLILPSAALRLSRHCKPNCAGVS